jgi:hypothetical protein
MPLLLAGRNVGVLAGAQLQVEDAWIAKVGSEVLEDEVSGIFGRLKGVPAVSVSDTEQVYRFRVTGHGSDIPFPCQF